jgi:hypothetical protein
VLIIEPNARARNERVFIGTSLKEERV